jgi:hypothetical protein
MPYISSVSLQLQRVTTENAHVSVPLSEELWQPNPDGSGTFTINTEKLLPTEIEMGKLLSTNWTVEGDVVIIPHPLQTPPQ